MQGGVHRGGYAHSLPFQATQGPYQRGGYSGNWQPRGGGSGNKRKSASYNNYGRGQQNYGRGGNQQFGGRGGGRGHNQYKRPRRNEENPSVDQYFKPSFLDDPWRALLGGEESNHSQDGNMYFKPSFLQDPWRDLIQEPPALVNPSATPNTSNEVDKPAGQQEI